jgi:hypothetical protein
VEDTIVRVVGVATPLRFAIFHIGMHTLIQGIFGMHRKDMRPIDMRILDIGLLDTQARAGVVFDL